MTRHRLKILSAFSLLLFAAVVALWVRSYWVEDMLTISPHGYLFSGTGSVTLLWFHERDIASPAQRLLSLPPEFNATFWREIWAGTTEQARLAGFRYGRLHSPVSSGFTLLAVPYWSAAGLTPLLPMLWAGGGVIR